MIHKTTRSILSVLLAALLLVTSIPLTPAFADGGGVSPQSESAEGRALTGSGTEGDPYKIATAADLLKFADKVNNQGQTSAWAVLTDDIDLNPGFTFKEDGSYSGPAGVEPQEWTPIGNSSRRYSGNFDGANYTISGLYINRSADYQGLFGYVSTDGDNKGTVQNLSVSGSVKGNDYVGGIAGRNIGNVINCAFSGSVKGSGLYVGGVAGYNGGSVTNSYNTGSVSGVGSVGGVVGYNRGSVENCYNTGAVNSSSDSPVGGVVGYNDTGATVSNCYNIGTVTGSGDRSNVGGVVGDNYGSVTNCYFLKDTAKKGIGVNEGNDSAEGAAVVDDLSDQDQFKDWDFIDTWRISQSLGFPVLQDNAQDGLPPGLGTEASPYEISTADQLENFRDIVNGANNQTADTDAHAVLMDDIDLNPGMTYNADGQLSNPDDLTTWGPIGTSEENAYTGNFDGNGHKIENLYINTTDSGADNQGLFGYVGSGGIVQNLSVTGTVSGNRYVGGVVGYNRGSVENCYNTGEVSGNRYVGGVVGKNEASVTNCYNTGTGTVTGTDDYVGGVVGKNEASVTNCYNTGTGTVTGTGDYVGGVVGYNGGIVENCYNTGSVSGLDSVGGVAGWNDGSVENCYNTGKVSGGAGVGGVVGYNSSTVENCYNIGEVSGSTVGGVVGYNSIGNVKGCYFLQTETVNTKLQGIGKNEGTSSNVEARTDDAFHSGEVAWRLENGQTAGSSQVWGQSNLKDKNSWPTLVALDKNAKTVYQVTLKYDHAGAQDITYYTDDTATPSEQPSRDGYTFDHWDKTEGEGNTITYTAQWTPVAEPDPDPEPTPEPEPEEPPYSGKYSYEVSTSVGDHGSLTVDRYATEGDTVTIQVAPDQAYKLDDLSVTANGKDVELTANSDGTYSFTMPSADVKITATFAEDPDWTEPEPEPSTDVSDLFIDIAPDAWYKDAIQYAYDNGLMTGVSATEFAPEQTTTRAMIVSILARLEGVTTAQAAGFADVNDEWYATAVNWAANVGVVNGYEDNTFKPNTAITREQLAAILMNYAAYKGEDVSARADLATYTDQPSTWAQEAMQWAVAEKLITGVTADTLQPQGAATRAQVAAILQRFLSE